jgi:two-component system OmpR family sensor kinase/two-component system sensor histidine kinase BaeS
MIIALVSIASVVVIARQGAVNELRGYMFRGSMYGEGGLVSTLEDYYAANQSWEGAQSLLEGSHQGRGQGMGGPGMMGMMGQRLQVTDALGNVVADSQGIPSGNKLSNQELEGAIVLHAGSQTIGYLVAEGAMNFGQADEVFLAGRISRAALIAGLLAGGLSLILALLLAYTLGRPVTELTRAAEKMAGGDLSVRVPVRGKDELALLGTTFNRMAVSLQQAEDSRRAMTADIAHELRNPLAVQRASLEALQDGIYPLSPENLAPVLEQNLLLNRLVDDLRTLASADAGQLKLEPAPTDFQSLISQVIQRFSAQASNQSVAIRLEPVVTPLPLVRLDSFRIEQIIGNLLSNALRYTPEGGFIELDIAQEGSTIRLSVHDSGPGIPSDSLPYVFERFYRADKSRSREVGGSGLGLAIAQKLAQAHGGSLMAANHPQGGAIFTLTLPM